MTGVIIKNSGVVVDKRAFGGDESVVPGIVAQLQAKNPTLVYEVHHDTDPDWSTAFDQVVLPPPAVTIDQGWATAKAAGGVAALIYIAKKLGLE